MGNDVIASVEADSLRFRWGPPKNYPHAPAYRGRVVARGDNIYLQPPNWAAPVPISYLYAAAPNGGTPPTISLVIAGNVFTYRLMDVYAIDVSPPVDVATGVDDGVVVDK